MTERMRDNTERRRRNREAQKKFRASKRLRLDACLTRDVEQQRFREIGLGNVICAIVVSHHHELRPHYRFRGRESQPECQQQHLTSMVAMTVSYIG